MTSALRLAALAILVPLLAMPCEAGERYAIVITGASGGPEYAERFDAWRDAFTRALVTQLGFRTDRIMILAEAAPGARPATREHVRIVVNEVGLRAREDDLVLILLMGHGSVFEGDDAKFNLVGPDLSADDWAELVRLVPGRLVFVNGTAGSSSFLRKLAAKNRVVITATNATAQRFTTVFPQFFVGAFTEPGADTDKDGRVSVWEAFEYASAGVRRWFRDQGQPATERALLDDTGAGRGIEAGEQGADGAVAKTTFLTADADQGAKTGGSETLIRRRQELDAEIRSLNLRRADLASADFESRLERLLLELARIDQQLRPVP